MYLLMCFSHGSCVFPGHSIARASAVLSRLLDWNILTVAGDKSMGCFFTKGMGFLAEDWRSWKNEESLLGWLMMMKF